MRFWARVLLAWIVGIVAALAYFGPFQLGELRFWIVGGAIVVWIVLAASVDGVGWKALWIVPGGLLIALVTLLPLIWLGMLFYACKYGTCI